MKNLFFILIIFIFSCSKDEDVDVVCLCTKTTYHVEPNNELTFLGSTLIPCDESIGNFEIDSINNNISKIVCK